MHSRHSCACDEITFRVYSFITQSDWLLKILDSAWGQASAVGEHLGPIVLGRCGLLIIHTNVNYVKNASLKLEI